MSTAVATTKTVLNKAKRITLAMRMEQTAITPTITSHYDAQDKADHLNLIDQALIDAKEGITKAITMKVGPNITDTSLKTADGMNFWSMDD